MFEDLLDETGRFMVETADRMLADLCGPEVLKAADAGEWPEAPWAAVSEAGFDRATLPEDRGGAGLTLAEALPLAAVAARHAAPLPLAETLLAGHVLGSTGLPAPEGLVVLAAGPGALLRPEGSGWRLHGRIASVPWGERADAVVLVADGAEGPRLCVLDRTERRAEPGSNMANEPRDTLIFDLRLDDVRTAPFVGGTETVLRLAALARSVQIAGALDRLRDMTVQYAQERVQFGRPLGRFQAIQQNVAVLASDAAAAEAAAAVGLLGVSDARAVAVAKARTGEAASRAAGIAHQVHGAMGFAREHRLHHLTRRLWSWRDEYGNELHWQAALGNTLLRHAPEDLWPVLTTIGRRAAR
ncbi:acyl-CoA dehydrogenase family protein [Pinisolibacter aquiterrae]|uniref:acyl-CoA dehydrogenase family protein n=1 Tax=Pinisolibacter aquiterrae TaxID=2815579 RepID=UPI001C3C9C54|nr:acyl-CoA dehydrogenase family protein [Pinisolibacter aquiterrae]MBV5266884.1 acyl-CoA/acyl-ACP dehydrogenase [Pinisolibacter aquiterrae]MCC8234805.1 acyl-CoA/acyl-ACP dehydrogenase [Pinisolibacter aquiterrae]